MFKAILKTIKWAAILLVALITLVLVFGGKSDKATAGGQDTNTKQEQVAEVFTAITTSDVPWMQSGKQDLAEQICINAAQLVGIKSNADEWLFQEYKGREDHQHPNWSFILPGKPYQSCNVLYKEDVMSLGSLHEAGINARGAAWLMTNHKTGKITTNSY